MHKLPKLIAKATSILITGSILANGVVPVFAQLNSSITGNGSNSNNTTDYTISNTTDIFQTNDATVDNTITISSNTGGNDSTGNTGSKVETATGDTNLSANITNDVNSNQAVVDQCNCNDDVNLTIDSNGTGSTNELNVTNDNLATTVQDNTANISNILDLSADTGDNNLEDNTGGSVKLTTGQVAIDPVSVFNFLNSNVATVGPGDGSSDASLSLGILQNGSDTTNSIGVTQTNINDFFQTTDTTVLNDLILNGDSGGNNVNDNTLETGGNDEVTVKTGNVNMGALVDTASGFNIAQGNCGCISQVDGEISGNGTQSASDIILDLLNDSLATQDNVDDFATSGDFACNTGDNGVDSNTNGNIDTGTGQCDTNFDEFNTGGSNFFGDIAQQTAGSFDVQTLLSVLGVDVEVF